MKVNLIIETSQEYFCNWLEDFTQDAPYLQFPTEKGQISLQKARLSRIGYGGNPYMCMEGCYLTLAKNDTQTAYLMNEVIRFKIIPLNQGRIEINAVCNQPAVSSYFQSLLAEIGKRWPPKFNPEKQIAKIQDEIEIGFSELQKGQTILRKNQEIISTVVQIIHEGHISQGEMSRNLDAIRRAIKYMQKQQSRFSKEISQNLIKATKIVDSEINIQQKLELTIPILPALLNYKAEIGTSTDVDLDNLFKGIYTGLHSLLAKSQNDQK